MTKSSFLNLTLSLFVSVTFLYSQLVKAEQLSTEQENALSGALDELRDPVKRSENLKKDPKAAKSDEMVKEVGGEFSEEIYGLAGEAMQNLVRSTQGDTAKMEKILQAAEKNPEAFANSFTPEQKKALRELSNKIEKSKKKSLH